MNYVLLYVYVIIAETTIVNYKSKCFINSVICIKGKLSVSCSGTEKDQVELIESPSKPSKVYNSKFFNLDSNKTENRGNITEEDKIKWASFEARRFTYKLGRYNKKLRKVKEDKSQIYTSFTVDDNELKKLNQKSRRLKSSIQTFRKYRKLFLKYLKGLHLKTNPVVPYVPPKLRSEKISSKYYKIAPEPKIKPKQINKIEKTKNRLKKDKVNREEQDSQNSKNETGNYSQLMSILAEVKGKKYYRGRIY